jgi:hypothetical protein
MTEVKPLLPIPSTAADETTGNKGRGAAVPNMQMPAGAFFASVPWAGPEVDATRETASAVLAWL